VWVLADDRDGSVSGPESVTSCADANRAFYGPGLSKGLDLDPFVTDLGPSSHAFIAAAASPQGMGSDASKYTPEAAGRICAALGGHAWRWSPVRAEHSPLMRLAGLRLDCVSPTLLRCMCCGALETKRCGLADVERCEPCGLRHRADVGLVMQSGIRQAEMLTFVTLTAPGRKVIPFDSALCKIKRRNRCSGKLGCRVEALAAARFHHRLGVKWNWFCRDVRRTLERDFPELSADFVRALEDQLRGVAHIHSIWRFEGCPGLSADVLSALVVRLADRHGFGEQVDFQVVDMGDVNAPVRCARYLAKYASKAAGCFSGVVCLDEMTGELTERRLRPWSASRGWGITMRDLAGVRLLWARANAGGPADPDDGGDGAADLGAGGALDNNSAHYPLEAAASVCGSVEVGSAV